MQFAVMRATDGDGVFVADLSPERARLGEAKMMRVRRGASTYDARLPGDEFTMFLVAQANGLAHDTAAAGVDFLRDFRENGGAVRAFDTRLRGRNGNGLARRFLRRLGDERFQLRPEAVFDELRIGGRQQVLVGEPPVNPVRRIVGTREVVQFGDQAIAQRGGLFVRQNGPRGRTNFGLPRASGAGVGALSNICDFDIGGVSASSGRTPFPFPDGVSATNFAPAPRSGASRSSSPAMPTRVKRARTRGHGA
jgi:hypothetical protein